MFPLSVQTKLSAIVPKSIKEVASPIQLEESSKLTETIDEQQVPIINELVFVSWRDPKEYWFTTKE